MKYYTTEAVKDLLQKYEEHWWTYLVKDWCLLDEYLCFWNWLKYSVIQEHYLNERSSTYTIRMFKKLPKKYSEYFNFECF